MKILYVVSNEPDTTGSAIIEAHRKSHEVTLFDLRSDKDYGKLVEQIEAHDKVISW